jgi:Flp pilus assembly protein TadB
VTFAEFFAGYWWLMFPIFGMVMAFQGMSQDEKRTRDALRLIRSYVEQGKEPPSELLKLAQKGDGDWDANLGMGSIGGSGGNGRAWSAVTFAALAAGFGVGYWFVRGEDFAFAFLIVAVTMGVLALGGLLILIFGRK